MVKYRCRDCKWFDSGHKSLVDLWDFNKLNIEVGYCRKHKPVIYQGTARHGQFVLYYGGWPLVEINDFCGEFRQDES